MTILAVKFDELLEYVTNWLRNQIGYPISNFKIGRRKNKQYSLD